MNRKSKIENQKFEVGFEVGAYDKSRPLVIDPVLSYSTYLGGSDIDSARGIATDSLGSAYVVGQTDSADFPTVHPLQPTIGGEVDFPDDLFVSKLSADGSTLVYSTYLGGSAREYAGGIAVDAFGSAYITGTTLSTNYPTTQNGFDPTCGLGPAADCDQVSGRFLTDAVITKLNPAGSEIEYSSYYAADPVIPTHDQGLAIAVGADFTAYVTGSTSVNDYDVFVFRVDPTGANLLVDFVFGGSGKDLGQGIAVDAAGNAHVTGYTSSPDFPLLNEFQSVLLGVSDGFVTTISPAAAITYSTYMGGDAGTGGAGFDQGNTIAVDTTGMVYVAGVTNSRAAMLGFAIPGAPVQADCALNGLGNCISDAFAAKLDTTQAGAASLLYFTYHGGSNADTGTGIAVDPSGNSYIIGYTNSLDLPVAGGPFQSTYGGGNTDAFVTKFDATASNRLYSSYLGGTGADLGFAIATDPFANALVAGETCSTNFPTSQALQPASAGNCDAFVAKVLVGPDLRLTATNLSFGTQALGIPSAPQTITLTSSGDANLTINSITVTGGATDFSLTTTCPVATPMPNGSTCGIEVTFTPSVIGPRTGTITIDSTVPGGPHLIHLQGTGGTFGVSPLELVFGDQGVGTTSVAKPVTITNTGTVAVTIFGIDATGDFSQNNDCVNSLDGGASCTINVTFTPTSTGLRAGAITITDDDPTSPQTVVLSGHGTAPIAAVAPSNLAFGNQGVTGAAQVVTLTNNGNAPLAIASIGVTGPFSQTNTCGGALVAGASCQVTVSFSPVAPGAAVGQLTITDDAAGSPHTVALSGTGVIPVVSLSPTGLTFAEQPVSTTSDLETVVLSNTGNATLNITSAALTGVNSAEFNLVNNCPAALAAGQSCALTVSFAPAVAGTRLASVLITDDAPASPQDITLTGVGVLAPAVTLTNNNLPTSSLSFLDTPVGVTSSATTSGSNALTLTNTGSAELLISSIATTGDFTKSDQCGAALAVNASCVISVTFKPTAVGNRYGTLTITDNATGSPHVVLLAGNGLAVPTVSLFPTTLTFGDQAVNSTSAAQTVTLTNTGGASLAITSVSIVGLNGGDFGISSSTCTGTFVPGTGCAISVVFTPSAVGARVASLTIVDDAPNSPQSVVLAGNGVLPAGIAFNPTSLSFPSASVGTASAPQTVTLTSTGGGTLNLSITKTGANADDFSLSHNCGATIAPSLNCTLTVIFTPSAGGSRLANISVTDNAPGSPHTVPLFGAGSTAAGNFSLSATPASNEIFAGDGASFTVTVTPLNGFNAQVNLSCSSSLSQGSCSISPTSVKPNGTDPVTALLTVATTARVMAPPAPGPGDFFPRGGLRWAPWLAVLMAMALFATARRKRAALLLAAMMAVMMFWTACGAGGTTVNIPRGTPAGNYSITVTATSGTTTQTTAVSLKVD